MEHHTAATIFGVFIGLSSALAVYRWPKPWFWFLFAANATILFALALSGCAGRVDDPEYTFPPPSFVAGRHSEELSVCQTQTLLDSAERYFEWTKREHNVHCYGITLDEMTCFAGDSSVRYELYGIYNEETEGAEVKFEVHSWDPYEAWAFICACYTPISCSRF